MDDHQPEKKFSEISKFFRKKTELAAYVRHNLRDRREGPGKPIAITTLTCYKDYNEISMRSQTNFKQTTEENNRPASLYQGTKDGLFLVLKISQHGKEKYSILIQSHQLYSFRFIKMQTSHFQDRNE